MRLSFAVLALALGLAASVQAAPAKTLTNADFDAQCALCHQAGGAGLPGQFPRLAGRVNVIAGAPEGRNYMVQVILNGLSGQLIVDDKPLSGFMTPFGSLTDVQIADILNYLAAQKPEGAKAKPFTAGEVAKLRAGPAIKGAQLQAKRAELVTAKVVP